MTKPSPLQTLIELTQNRMDEAARTLGKLLASERADEQKLELLINYRQEYHGRFLAAAQEGLGPEAWRNYQGFLGKLDDAVEQQTRLVAQAKERSVAGQQAWMAQRTKSKAYDTLNRRAESREAFKEAKREQKASDEHAVKNFLDQHKNQD
ncbi:MAG: flagellar export protein FliJ [Rhodocyclaceae bacterium]|nr:flagellar export protein FliJ [Rhodocyclaceae bacterium]